MNQTPNVLYLDKIRMQHSKTKRISDMKGGSNDIIKKYSKIPCDKGRISKNPVPDERTMKYIERTIGEYFDILCVALDKKPLAASMCCAKLRKYVKKLDKKKVNKIIDFANKKNVNVLINKKSGGMYLKSIYFKKKNYNKALKLMGILWYPYELGVKNNKEYSYYIGKLLGYDIKNIKYFIEQDNEELTKKDISKYNKKLQKMKVNMEFLNKNFKMIHKTHIDNV